MKEVSVNTEQSKAIGKIVGKLSFKAGFLKRDFLTTELEDEIKAAMYYYAVGICHQTYDLANPGLSLYGWDFLEYGFLQLAKEKPELLNAAHINTLEACQLIELIKPFFAENNQPDKCTLDRLEERASLWKEMAEFILKNSGSLMSFLRSLDNKPSNFYNNLQQTEAYSDPFQKKTSFLMKILEDAGLVSFTGKNDIIPIMDYHMQRVLLRTACVEVWDDELNRQLIARHKIDDDSNIRKACIDSMKIIAKESGYSVLKMNDVFYTMGRSCCNVNPICVSAFCEKDPCTLSLAVSIPEKHDCIFENICRGAKKEEYRNLWQPMIETHYY